MRKNDYEPDMVKTGEYQGQKYVPGLHQNFDMRPKVVEVAVAWRDVSKSMARKLEKLSFLGYSADDVEIIVVGIDGTASLSTSEPQDGFTKQIESITSDILKIIAEIPHDKMETILNIACSQEKQRFPHIPKNDFCKLELKTGMSKLSVQQLEVKCASVTKPMEVRKHFPVITRRSGEQVDKVSKTKLMWKAVIPIWLRAWPDDMDTRKDRSKAIIKGIDSVIFGDVKRTREFLTLIHELKQSDFEIRSKKDLSDSAGQLFGTGKKAESKRKLLLQTPYKLHEEMPEESHYEKWMTDLIMEMAVHVDTLPEIPIHKESMNTADDEFIQISEHVITAMDKPQCNYIPYIIEAMSIKLSSYVFNSFDSVVAFPLLINGFIWGLCIKGPAHPRRDSDKVPLFFRQFITSEESKVEFIRNMCFDDKTKKEKICLSTCLKDTFVLITQTSWWPAKIRAMMSCTRVFIQAAGEVAELIRGKFCDKDKNTDWLTAKED